MKRVFLLAAVAASLFVAAPALAAPSPGSPGLGDRLFPNLGNGGYDVQHYDLDLRYATSAPTQGIDGTVTILAKATQDLSAASTSTSRARASAASRSTACRPSSPARPTTW